MSERVRAIFLSDIHLGTRACQAERLLEFLKTYESDYLFLLGDIIDFWAMHSRGIYWSAAQNTLLQKLLKRARHHVQVVFIPGNHDEAVREHVGTSFGNIRVAMDYVHVAGDGKRYLLLHGDEFDQVTRYHRWIAVLGDHVYTALVTLNVLLSRLRRRLRLSGPDQRRNQMRRRWIYPANGGEPFEVDGDYVAPSAAVYNGLLWNDRTYQDAGDPRFASRSQHKEFMKANGLTTVDDYKSSWSKQEKQRAEFYTNAPDRSRTEDVVRAFTDPKKNLSRKNIIPE
jgi:UDP-2,3-diacylglucosamine pyrophosphatase LpxH